MIRVDLPTAAATADLGARIAASMPAEAALGWTVSLRGELGAGKSTLVRGFLAALGHAGPVPSPTYTLVEPYELRGIRVFHADLYRIGGEDELYFLGGDEFATGLTFLEWPERAPSFAARADLEIALSYAAVGRVAAVHGRSARAAAWLAALRDEITAESCLNQS